MTNDSIFQLCALLAGAGGIVQLYGLWLYPTASAKKRKRKAKRGARLHSTHDLIDAGGIALFTAMTVYIVADSSGEALGSMLPVTGPLLIAAGSGLWLGTRRRGETPGGAGVLLPYAIAVMVGAMPLLALPGYEFTGGLLIFANWALIIRAEVVNMRREDEE